jgi:Asp-tRNA(Asn)/Glu-tRNA(Gln) amidotransferase A subunit family amidase
MLSGSTRGSIESARAAKAKVQRRFSRIASVNGVGIVRVPDGRYGVKVNLDSMPASSVPLPHEIDGIPVVVEVIGPASKRAG